jgi:hypothetical protein
MIKIENTSVFGWEAAIRGARNPMNSWDRSDSHWGLAEGEVDYDGKLAYYIGENDLKLLRNLAKAGNDHGKFMRMINVTCDITAPLYWLKEYDTYKVSTVANSCSTMHKIHAKEFTLDDFSCEHLIDDFDVDVEIPGTDHTTSGAMEIMYMTIDVLNGYRSKFLETKEKKYWWQMIQLLPSSYNQRRTVQLNYAVLKAMYHARKHHKLDEWREFCQWIESLPYSELITEVERNG